jgi:hypothetical protein
MRGLRRSRYNLSAKLECTSPVPPLHFLDGCNRGMNAATQSTLLTVEVYGPVGACSKLCFRKRNLL